MRRLAVLVSLGLMVGACSSKPEPPPAPFVITPGSRLLWSNGTDAWWIVCDQGTRIIMSSHGAVATIPSACPDGRP